MLPNLVPPRHIDDCHAIHFLHWEFGDPLWSNHQNLSDLGTTVPARLLQEALVIFVIKQTDIAIRVLRKVCVDTMLTRNPFHFCSRLHWQFMRRIGSVLTSLLWVSPKLYWSTFINQILSEFLLPIKQLMQYISLYLFWSLSYFCGLFAAGFSEALHSYLHFFLILYFQYLCFLCSPILTPVMKMTTRYVYPWSSQSFPKGRTAALLLTQPGVPIPPRENRM